MAALQLPPTDRPAVASRTLDKINEDHRRFVEEGSNIKNAKLFNNCPMEALFNIPLDQVCNFGFYTKIHSSKTSIFMQDQV